MIMQTLQVLGGLVAVNVGEWVVHKYVLHGLGKKKDSIWAFHWREHHRNCRRHDYFDPDYQRTVWGFHAQGKETIGLTVAGLAVLPLVTIVPWFCGGVWAGLSLYYWVHKKSHRSPGWGKTTVPWHYDHHMGKDQDANWCVTFPLMDYIMGTRKKP